MEFKLDPGSDLSKRVFNQFNTFIELIGTVRDSIIDQIKNGEINNWFDLNAAHSLNE